MSRMPPVPAAGQPAYGPGAVAKDFITDLSHHADLPFHGRREGGETEQQGQGPDSSARRTLSAQSGINLPEAVDDLGGMVPRRGGQSDAWMLVVFGAVVAAIFWVAGRQRRGKSH